MKKTNSLGLTGIALSVPLLLICACNREYNQESKSIIADSTVAMAASSADTSVAAGSKRPNANAAAGPRPGMSPDLTLPDGEHLIPIPWAATNSWLIKNASMDLWVSDATSSARRLKRWLNDAQGYYSNWNQYQDRDSLQIDMKVIVPSIAYEAFKDSVETLGTVKMESAQADDITDKVFSTVGQHKVQQNLGDQDKALESKLHKGSDQLAAQSSSESYQLAAENSLENLNALRRQVSKSEIDIQITQFHPGPVLTFAERLGNQLLEGWRSLEVILIILATLWPWILLAAGGIFLWRMGRHKQLLKHR